MTVNKFISEHLIHEIGEIKTKYPYFAFVLIAIGIEFLGKCLNDQKEWNTSSPKKDFELGLALFPEKYKSMNLRDRLRNGMVHSYMTKEGLRLSDFNTTSDPNTISCDELFGDFVEASQKVLNGTAKLPIKKLSDVLFSITIEGTENGNKASISGATIADSIHI